MVSAPRLFDAPSAIEGETDIPDPVYHCVRLKSREMKWSKLPEIAHRAMDLLPRLDCYSMGGMVKGKRLFDFSVKRI